MILPRIFLIGLRIGGTLICLGFLYLIAGLALEGLSIYELPIQPTVGLFLAGTACCFLAGITLFWSKP